jgi:hypothetical protein
VRFAHQQRIAMSDILSGNHDFVALSHDFVALSMVVYGA